MVCLRHAVSLALLVLMFNIITVHARFMRMHPHDFSVRIRPSKPAVVVRSVNDVAPAVQNATAIALQRARSFAANYANTLRIVMIPAGIIVTFLGYFLLTPVLFGAGMLSGGGASFIALRALLGHEKPSALWLAVVGSLLCGFIVGLIAVKLISVGMFAIGAVLGVVIASALKPSVLGRVYPANHDVGFYIGAVVIGAILGLIALRFQKSMVILATSYGGAFAFFFGIGYFAGHFPTTATLSAAEKGHFSAWFIAYTALTALVGSAGAITQFRLASSRPPSRRVRRRSRQDAASGDDEWYEEQQRLAGSENDERKQMDSGNFDSVTSAKQVFDGSTIGTENGADYSRTLKPRYYGNVNVNGADELAITGNTTKRDD